MKPKTASWHCHHETLCEWDSEPRKNRIIYIRLEKPQNEQELRLRLYQPMSAEAVKLLDAYEAARKPARDAYDVACKLAGDVYDAALKPAWDAYDAVWGTPTKPADAARKPAGDVYDAALKLARDVYEAACKLAGDAYDVACKPEREALEAIHRIECTNCPWDGRRKILFDNPPKRTNV